MVTCVCMGGIGNNLFQLSATISYGLKHNIDFFFPTEVQSPHYAGQKVFYSPYLNYNDSYSELCNVVYQEPFFHYQEIPKYDFDVVVLRGYFQSWRYIFEYRDEIIRLLNIPYELKIGWTFIHLRLDDYTKLSDYHETISTEYIEAAMEYMIIRGYRKFIVLSDDIELAKKIICYPVKWHNITLEYSENKNEIDDLKLMADCQNGIISASSFSWWGAWLGRNKDRIITFPSKWFGKKINHNVADLCPPEWIKIKS